MPIVPPPWLEYTWEGIEGYLWTGALFISKDYNPETGMAMAFFAPPGGRAAIPAMVKGDPGIPFTPGEVILDGELEWDDPDPVTAEWVLATPGTDIVPAVYDFHYTQRKGAPGDPSSLDFLDATDLVGDPLAGYYPAWVADTGTALGGAASGEAGAIWTPPKLGGSYWPALMNSTTSADGAQRTLGQVTIPDFPYPVQLEAYASTILTGTGAGGCIADLMVRVGNATSGDIIARKAGLTLTTPRDMTLMPGPPGGGGGSIGQLAASSGSTLVSLRAERQSGSDSFSTTGSQTTFYVRARALS